MFSDEMTPEMRKMLELFNDELARAGWAVGNYEAIFRAGMSIAPEGTATMQHDGVTLEVNLSLSEPELQLYILNQEQDHLVQLILECSRLPALLQTLKARQFELDTATFPQFLLKAAPYAEKVWFVDHEGTRFLLDIQEPPEEVDDEV